ncbi:MAG: type II toxin-antitoxin system ParD family antitoxin [Deinococcota bacterium]|nr:type II toxin-antitoxin system ParD family antitoxin [Deinococcota bacterium]
MILSLNEKQERLVNELVASGRYQDAAAVLDDALKLLEAREKKLAELRSELQKGMDDLESGWFTTYTKETSPQLFEDVKRRGRERLAAKQNGR